MRLWTILSAKNCCIVVFAHLQLYLIFGSVALVTKSRRSCIGIATKRQCTVYTKLRLNTQDIIPCNKINRTPNIFSNFLIFMYGFKTEIRGEKVPLSTNFVCEVKVAVGKVAVSFLVPLSSFSSNYSFYLSDWAVFRCLPKVQLTQAIKQRSIRLYCKENAGSRCLTWLTEEAVRLSARRKARLVTAVINLMIFSLFLKKVI